MFKDIKYKYIMGYIYIITNKINGKKYIGQTCQSDINKRWKQHKSINKKHIGQILFNAYTKYGIHNFTFKILCICFDSDTNNYEIEYIKKYDTIYPNGYNLQPGGNSRKHNEFTIKQISNSLKGEKSFNFGKKLSVETKQKISQSLRGKNHPNFNKKMSDEQKNKIKNTVNSFSVEKRKEISLKISNSLKLYNNNVSNRKSVRSKKICQYDLNGILISTFNSISEASQNLNLDRMTISRCCNDKYEHYKTCGNYIWKYCN